MERYVVRLAEIGRDDLPTVGGKGANLGELIRGGFPVPAGFVVTTAASTPPDLARWEGGAALRRAALEAEIPDEVEVEIRAGYRELGEGPVAVRSSATTEDLPEAAFAGQQDTYLNIIGADQVVEAVRRCWASLWTDRAIDYRNSHGIDQGRARIAVVVQSMVDAEFAGVMFTSDPVTGDRGRLVVDANPGLGEAVVSGRVTPEHLVVDKRRDRVLSRSAGKQEVRVRAVAGGGTEEIAGPSEARLPPRAVRRLAATGRAVERYFGAPQDIEWVWSHGEVQVVQARPITALPEQPARLSRVQQAMCRMVPEIVPIRPYPLDMSAWTRPMLTSLLKLIDLSGMRLPVLDEVFVEQDGVVQRIELPQPRPTVRSLAAPLRFARIARRHDPAHWKADPLVAQMYAERDRLRAVDLKAARWADLVRVLEDGPSVADRAMRLRIRYLPRPMLAMAGLVVSLAVMRRLGSLGALLSGVDTLTEDSNRALERLAAQVRSSAELRELVARGSDADPLGELRSTAPEFAAAFEEFLVEYGHRDTTTPALMTQPTWWDVPETVWDMVRGIAAQPAVAEVERPNVRAERELFAHPLLRWASPRRVLRGLLRQARWFQQVRDDTRYQCVLALPTMRAAALEMGARLVRAGALDVEADVFHLRLGELRELGERLSAEQVEQVRAVMLRRRTRRAELVGVPLVPTPPPVAGPDESVARGTPGSAGVAEGPVRVIRSVEEFGNFRVGEVLVAPYTNPAWTPLFRRAAAVVVDTGSMASHAAIVAREYGIPAVMGAGTATSDLREGRLVRVDGNTGLVLSAEGSSAR